MKKVPLSSQFSELKKLFETTILTDKGQFDIKPFHGFIGSHKTGSLPSSLGIDAISAALGFGPTSEGDQDKVTAEWNFTVNGQQTSIWDYKGNRWSTFDPSNSLPKIFGLP